MSEHRTQTIHPGPALAGLRRVFVTLVALCGIVAIGAWLPRAGNVDAGFLASPEATPISASRTLDDVITALRTAGLAVEETDQTVQHDFFAVPATILRVDGQDLQVLIYPSEAARTADSDRISEHGTEIGTSMIMWIATPHFVAVGNVLTLFVSNDEGLAQRIAEAIAGLAPAVPASPVASPMADHGTGSRLSGA